jgi:hypothetical protein
MEPFVQYAIVCLSTIVVMLLGFLVFKDKDKVEPLLEESLESLAVKEFQVLQGLILAQQQEIAAKQAALAASQARFVAAKNAIAAIN